MKKADKDISDEAANKLPYPKCSSEMETVALKGMYIPKLFRGQIKKGSKYTEWLDATKHENDKDTEPSR